MMLHCDPEGGGRTDQYTDEDGAAYYQELQYSQTTVSFGRSSASSNTWYFAPVQFVLPVDTRKDSDFGGTTSVVAPQSLFGFE